MAHPSAFCFNTERQAEPSHTPAAALRQVKIDIRKRRILGLFWTDLAIAEKAAHPLLNNARVRGT
jgi:hypothetical protein